MECTLEKNENQVFLSLRLIILIVFDYSYQLIEPCEIICMVTRFSLFHIFFLSHINITEPAHEILVMLQKSLRIRAVSPEPSLFAQMKYESRRRVQPKIRHLPPLDGCACAFEE